MNDHVLKPMVNWGSSHFSHPQRLPTKTRNPRQQRATESPGRPALQGHWASPEICAWRFVKKALEIIAPLDNFSRVIVGSCWLLVPD